MAAAWRTAIARILGGSINGTAIGATTPASGAFTTVTASGNVTASAQNFVVGTAGKGVDFSANTHAAGMTSELLTWYEEGTWTPNQGAGLAVTGAFSSSGYYTRIGRQVTATGRLTGATSVSCSAGAVLSSNLPFTAAGPVMLGNITNAAGIVLSGVSNNPTTAYVYAMEAQGATTDLYFNITYFV